MKKMKLYAAVAASTVCIVATGIGMSMAYMTEKDVKINTFTVGDLDLGLEEPDWNPEDGDGVNMYPGYTVYKNPTIKNITSDENGEEPCYARMIISIEDEEGKLITDQESINLIKQTIRFDQTYTGTYEDTGTGTLLVQNRIPGYAFQELDDIPMINPVFVQDTSRSTENVLVYNYMGEDETGILKIGEEAALFTTIAIPTDWNQTHFEKIGDYRLYVTAEAIQASGFESQEDAFLALDKEIEDGTVQANEK